MDVVGIQAFMRLKVGDEVAPALSGLHHAA